MYICLICSKEFSIYFIYNLHFTKCKENDVKTKRRDNEKEETSLILYKEEDTSLILYKEENTSLTLYKEEDTSLTLYKKKDIDVDFLNKQNNKLTPNILNEIKIKLKEFGLGIIKFDNRNKKSDILLPSNDYMNWIKTLDITIKDKNESFINVINVIKNILLRNKFQYSKVFYKFYCGKDNKTIKILVSKKILGINSIILSYKWEYMIQKDFIELIDYFWNIFKIELIDWYKINKEQIINKEETINNDKNYKRMYEQYYKNVMLIYEKEIIKEIKCFIIDKM